MEEEEELIAKGAWRIKESCDCSSAGVALISLSPEEGKPESWGEWLEFWGEHRRQQQETEPARIERYDSKKMDPAILDCSRMLYVAARSVHLKCPETSVRDHFFGICQKALTVEVQYINRATGEYLLEEMGVFPDCIDFLIAEDLFDGGKILKQTDQYENSNKKYAELNEAEKRRYDDFFDGPPEDEKASGLLMLDRVNFKYQFPAAVPVYQLFLGFSVTYKDKTQSPVGVAQQMKDLGGDEKDIKLAYAFSWLVRIEHGLLIETIDDLARQLSELMGKVR